MGLKTKNVLIKLTLKEPKGFMIVISSPRDKILEGKEENYFVYIAFQLISLYVHSNFKSRPLLYVDLNSTSNKFPLHILMSSLHRKILKIHVKSVFNIFSSCIFNLF